MKKIYDNVFDHPKKKHSIDIYGKDPDTLDELFDMVHQVVDHTFRVSEGEDADVRLVELGMKVESMRHVSCTHNAPLLGRTKWSSNDHNGPGHYPGFYGRIWIRYNKDTDCWGSEPFELAHVHTGSGGWGAYDGPSSAICTAHYRAPKFMKDSYAEPQCFSYDFRFFTGDFPKIGNDIEKGITAAVLCKKQPENIKFEKYWINPAQRVKDNDFIYRLDRFNERRILNRESIMC